MRLFECLPRHPVDDIAARLVAALPQDRLGKHIGDQLLHSATSGGANYEEARSAQSRRGFVHKVGLAAPRCEIPPLLREAGELIAILMSTHSDSRFTFTSPAPIAVPRPLFPARSSQLGSPSLELQVPVLLLSVVAHHGSGGVSGVG